MTNEQQNFILNLAPGAQAGCSQYGVLASITLAQAIIESGWGTSYSANNDKNLFGIKYPGAKPSGIMITQGSAASDGGYYRRYTSWRDSLIDHGFFLKNNSRYANIIGNTDYVFVANELKRAGYATDPAYASTLINTVRTYNLTQYDTGVYSGPAGVDLATYSQPTTLYSVTPNSLQSKEYLFGRKCRIIVSSLDGNTALDVSKLRVVFTAIKSIAPLQPQFSSIVIYNLTADAENTLIQQGYRVTIEAGYEGLFGLVFDGNVVQAIRDKEDATTYRLSLVAADADRWLSYSLSAFSLVRGQNKREALQNIASKSTETIALGSVSDSLTNTSYTRGKVFFGMARDYVKQIAKTLNATAYIDGGKINIVKADEPASDEAFELNPKSGLIEVPYQSDYMVMIKCLINPQIKLNSLIHVDNSLIRTQQYNQGKTPYMLDNDGLYRVVQLTYNGDTRGDNWYIEASCIPQAGVIPSTVIDSSQAWINV